MYGVQKFALWYDYFRLVNNFLAIPATEQLMKIFKSRFFTRANRFAESMSQDYKHRYVNYICYYSNEMKRGLYNQSFNKLFGNIDSYDIYANAFSKSNTPDKMDQTLYADISHYLPDDLLVKVDIASMAVSLEGRSPLLDHEFMELAAKIPFNLKLKGRNTRKYIFKKALEGLIPGEILYRPKKGFGVPIDQWFRKDLYGYTRNILLSPKSHLKNYFKTDYIKNLIVSHKTTGADYAYPIWALLTLELWFKKYFPK